MKLAHEDLVLLLNGLYELGEESFSVVRPQTKSASCFVSISATLLKTPSA